MTARLDVPLRVAVVQEGVQPKTIFSRFYRASVNMTEGNTPFSFVAEDISYPAPTPAAAPPAWLRARPAAAVRRAGAKGPAAARAWVLWRRSPPG